MEQTGRARPSENKNLGGACLPDAGGEGDLELEVRLRLFVVGRAAALGVAEFGECLGHHVLCDFCWVVVGVFLAVGNLYKYFY